MRTSSSSCPECAGRHTRQLRSEGRGSSREGQGRVQVSQEHCSAMAVIEVTVKLRRAYLLALMDLVLCGILCNINSEEPFHRVTDGKIGKLRAI
jgi:hypothetical protein